MIEKIDITNIKQAKQQGRKIKMLTAYDYIMARLIDQSAVDIILVGDSLANVVLGLESTAQIGMEEMLHHTKAVCRGVERKFVVADMPLGAYDDGPTACRNAERFVSEAGCDAIKLEWSENCLDVTRALIDAGYEVMGHVGLTPQTAESFSVQGKDEASARAILKQAKQLAELGCFALVLECVPSELARIITEQVAIPTIGIGAGVHCNGQVLVTYDLLGMYDRFRPKFVKQFATLDQDIMQALNAYTKQVDGEEFPGADQSFSMDPKMLERLEE